jgi:hypothetical protein
MSEERVTRSDMEAANRQAFVDVFGDPFAKPEEIVGQYQMLKSRGLIAAMRNNFDEGKATRNSATPSSLDFFIDVENIVERNLSESDQVLFQEAYLFENKNALTTKERSAIEQKLGRLFRARKISPVSRYFKTIRQAGVTGRKNGRG